MTNLTNELVDFNDDWAYTSDDVNHISQSDAAVDYINQKLDEMDENIDTNSHSSGDTVKGLSFFSLKSLLPGHLIDFFITWLTRTAVIFLT